MTRRLARMPERRFARSAVAVVVLAALALVAGSCSDDTSDDDGATGSSSTAAVLPPGASTTTTIAAAELAPLRILVTNDDGFDSDGIDAVVEALRAQPQVEVTVVAPATNQSGTGGKATEGDLPVADVTTKSGFPAKAVTGFPADSVVWAIERKGIDFTPDLVVSGINAGQNVGPLVDVSGTVGAARAAASLGIPALAASQGIEQFDYPTGVKAVTDWLGQHRSSLEPGKAWNLNIPSCPDGTKVVGTVEVPTATSAGDRNLLAPQSCAAFPGATPTDDVTAFHSGYITLSALN